MPYEIEEGMKLGTCDWCGDKDVPVFEDTSRCENCDGDFVRCDVCKTEEHRENLCRHLNYDMDSCEFYGSGINPNGDEHIKKSLFLLFDLMPGGFAVDLAKAIRSRKFYTYLIAPLIGSGGNLHLYGMPSREGMYDYSGWGNYLLRIGEDEGGHAEDTAMAYGWLSSLYCRKTEKANRTTLRWIEEYLKRFARKGRKNGKNPS